MKKNDLLERGVIGLRGDSLLSRILSPVALDESISAPKALPPAHICETLHGRRSLIAAGVGSPTVVFESGLGRGKEDWREVFHAVAAKTHAVAYDRAGYGKSEPSDLPRDGHQIVTELRAMLAAEDVAPPYVLVGHSLGGTIVKLFARLHPGEVAGVVLVDARHADLARHCRQTGAMRLLYEPPQVLFWMARSAARKEMRAVPVIMRQARRAGTFPSVPLIVLTHRKASTHWPRALGKAWAAGQRNLATMSSLGRIKVCDDSGHNVHQDRPDLVAQAVLNVVDAVRYREANRAAKLAGTWIERRAVERK